VLLPWVNHSRSVSISDTSWVRCVVDRLDPSSFGPRSLLFRGCDRLEQSRKKESTSTSEINMMYALTCIAVWADGVHAASNRCKIDKGVQITTMHMMNHAT